MKTFTLNNVKFTVDSGYFILESNRGNHTGYNRTWSQWNRNFKTRREAQAYMASVANQENHILPRRVGYCKSTENSAWVDGATYVVVNAAELVETIKGTGTNLANIYAITIIEE